MSPVTSLVLNRVQLIAPRIDEAMASAIVQAETRAQGFEQDRFPHIRPLNIRQDVRLSLEAEPLPGGWRVEGDPRKMGQLLLVDSETGMTVRFLKAPYTQPSLGDAGTLAKRTDGLHGETFLLIWAWKDPSDRESGYDLRIVHTRAPGAFGKATPCDLDLVIPRGGLVNEDGLRFVGSDEDSDLFIFDIPDENDTEGLAGQ